MPKPTAPLGKAHQIAAQVAAQQGFILVDVELVKEPTGRFLRFYIDKPDGIAIEDCEAFHRRIHPMMEFIDYDYMEVSSPGVDRPLKKPEDFERAIGMAVMVRLYRAVDGQKAFQGELTGIDGGVFTIEDASGQSRSFDIRETALVKPVIDFDEEDLQDEV